MRRVLLLLWIALPIAAQQMRSGETITVERILIDARVTNSNGDPILGLGAGDFRVRVDGKPAQIESVIWIPETIAARIAAGMDDETPPAEVNESLNVPAPRGRLLVFFFQTDFAREAIRVGGQMKIITPADKMVDALDPDDRVAVFSFDSHLKFRLDFTDDTARIRAAIRDAILVDEPAPPPIVPSPALAPRLDRQAMRDAGSSEEALILVANALRPIPGPKSLILFGWGLGRFSGGRVVLGRQYQIARRALESSRTSVFSIDITQADFHSLEVGLEQVSEDTGGFYAKTNLFPQLALDKLQRTLSGHYELEVRKPPTKVVGVHEIDVSVRQRSAHVMARTSYVDKVE